MVVISNFGISSGMVVGPSFFNTFAIAVQEAGLACSAMNPPVAVRRARRLSRLPPPSFLRRRVTKNTATTSAPVLDEDTVMSSPGEDGFLSSPPPPKRPCFPPSHPPAAKCAATTLWRASAFNAIVEAEKERVRSFFKANTTTVCFSFPGGGLSVLVKKDGATLDKLEQIAREVGALDVGVAATTATPKKRPFEVF
ncbi:unnamed protein product [Mucor hiemalis]